MKTAPPEPPLPPSRAAWPRLWPLQQRVPGRDAAAALRAALVPEVAWQVLHPVNERRGAAGVCDVRIRG